MKSHHWNKDTDARLREMWPYSYLLDIAQALECSVNTVRAHVALLGLTDAGKGAYYRERRTETNRQAAIKAGKRPPLYSVGHKHTDESKRKIADTRRRICASERRRVLFGLPQKTRIRVKV